jgi:hypothetical protein
VKKTSIGPDERAYSLKGPSSELDNVKECGWEDVALFVMAAALLVMGIVASGGVVDAMGRANAQYFSYGMYGGAGVLLVALVIKMVVCYRKQMDFAQLKQKGAEFAQNYQFPETFQTERGEAIGIPWARGQLAASIRMIVEDLDFQKDPVEYVLQNKRGVLFSQRYIGRIVLEFFEQHYKITKTE